jgi:NADPH-dependent 2,4-dienoyl-CoA reductase/sulfur reductase-like enzyme
VDVPYLTSTSSNLKWIFQASTAKFTVNFKQPCIYALTLFFSSLLLGRKRIAIIGAGPAGLAALKAVLDSGEWKKGYWDVVAFEAREDVGGVW